MAALRPGTGETGLQNAMQMSLLAVIVIVTVVAGILPVALVHAPPPVETYALTSSSSRVQEFDNPGVILSLKVSNANIGSSYQFNFTVVDPSGTSRNTVPNSTVAGSSIFVTSVAYPGGFALAASLKYVGNYTVNVQQNTPSFKASVATGRFQVGLTDSVVYQRTGQVNTQAEGYGSLENITVSLFHELVSVPGFPSVLHADPTGNLYYPWSIPASAPTGVYKITLTGGLTGKNPVDTQAFTVYPTNVTVPGLTVNNPSIGRTLTQQFLFAPQYPNGQRVQTGQARIRIAESDGVTYVYTNATYDSLTGTFRATYRLPQNAMTGIWIATIDAGKFDDGYGNGGPALSVVTGFYVQAASLNATITGTTSSTNKPFAAGDLIPIYASVRFPDGTIFDYGTVTAKLTQQGSELLVGSPITLTYVSGQQEWAGSYQVKNTDPSGIWIVTVDASDQPGDRGEGTSSAVVNVPPVNPPPPAQSILTSSTFLLIVAGLAAVILGGLAWALIAARRKVKRNTVKLDLRVVDKEVDKILDSEFFKSVKKQVEDKNPSRTEKPSRETGGT